MTPSEETTRRSDEIRKRRAERGRRSVPQPMRRNQSTSSAMPPVMARVPMASRPARSDNRAAKNRRRFDVALSVTPGAEMRLPALPQVRIGWRAISALLVLGLAAIAYYVWNSPAYRVGEAQVEGLQRLSSRDVNAVLDIAGQPIFTLNPSALEQELLSAFPEFSSASIEVSLPAEVKVTVEERAPVLVWRQDGRTELVDPEGLSFPVRDEAVDLTLPLVEANAPSPLQLATQKDPTEEALAALEEGEQPKEPEADPAARQILTSEMVSAILAMAQKAPENTSVIYDGVHGLGWKDPRGWDAYFGDASNMDMKLIVYQAIVQRLSAEDEQAKLISVEFVHAPYYRAERKSDVDEEE